MERGAYLKFFLDKGGLNRKGGFIERGLDRAFTVNFKEQRPRICLLIRTPQFIKLLLTIPLLICFLIREVKMHLFPLGPGVYKAVSRDHMYFTGS